MARVIRGFGLVLALVVATTGAPRAQIIDRILAVVDNAIITQSDVVGAVRLGLEKAPGAPDPTAAVLDSLIERQLTLTEVDRYAPPEPPDADVSLRFEQVRLSFPSTAAFRAMLAQTSLDEAQLRHYLRDDLRIDGYLQQRFGSTVQPTEEEILAYYRAHADQFSIAGTVRPYDEAQDDARRALVAERRKALIRDWVAGLRRRANVSVLYSRGNPSIPHPQSSGIRDYQGSGIRD